MALLLQPFCAWSQESQSESSWGESADTWAGEAKGDEAAEAPSAPPESVEPSAEVNGLLRYEPALPDKQELHKNLKEILARPEFQGKEEKKRSVAWWDRLLKLIERWLKNRGFNMSGGERWISILAAALLGVLLVLIVYLIVRWVWGGSVRLTGLRSPSREVNEDELGHSGLLKLAETALARGEFRQAVRLRFKAMLRLAPQESAAVLLTNSQLVRRLSRQYPELRSPLSAAVQRFEDIWYGGMDCSAQDYASVDRWAREVEAALPQPEAAEPSPRRRAA
jgi:hypothetical protein